LQITAKEETIIRIRLSIILSNSSLILWYSMAGKSNNRWWSSYEAKEGYEACDFLF
jgi:hypothetical protein